MFSRKTLQIALAAGLVLALALPGFASGRGEEMVRLTVQSEKESAVVEVPMQVLEFLNRHQVGKKFHAGELNGQKVTLSLDKLVQSLKENRGKSGETLLFSAVEEGKKTSFSASFNEAPARPGKAPANLTLIVRDLKAGKEKTQITVPLSTIDALLSAIQVDGEGDAEDVGKVLKDSMPFAKEIGTGLLARVLGPDEEIILQLE